MRIRKLIVNKKEMRFNLDINFFRDLNLHKIPKEYRYKIKHKIQTFITLKDLDNYKSSEILYELAELYRYLEEVEILNNKFKDLQSGDIVVFMREGYDIDNLLDVGNVLQKLVDGDAYHVEMVYDKLIEGYRTLGAGFDGVKMRVRKDLHRDTKYFIYRLKGVKGLKIRKVMWGYFTQLVIDDNTDYDFLGLAEASVNEFIQTLNKNWEKRGYASGIKKLISGKDPKFCSELVAEIISMYASKEFDDCDDVITPNDIIDDDNIELEILQRGFKR